MWFGEHTKHLRKMSTSPPRNTSYKGEGGGFRAGKEVFFKLVILSQNQDRLKLLGLRCQYYLKTLQNILLCGSVESRSASLALLCLLPLWAHIILFDHRKQSRAEKLVLLFPLNKRYDWNFICSLVIVFFGEFD